MTVAAQRLHTDRVFEMLRQSEHLQCRRRQAFAIFSFIVIFYIDFSCADNPNNNAEDTANPVTAALHRLIMAPLKLVTMILKEHGQTDLDNLENLINAANQKSPEIPVVSDNNGGAVQSDDVQSDSVPYQYMQSHLATRRIGNFYRFGGSG
ncbi:uncharacterized protein LOC126759219 [Bactrocera neohumeralis]|uniref:uncharacterized protein LOC120775487 n=1 Tax=Bactrocera tryoni TaxID=59916 RepID=UPI001A991E0D|nr:uncharacterized protein LOC120775487 [Bactrocera tryoni]XP_050329881.1 uncharacterized protein LOC126759219 [Bactrocera neohumeralis]